MQRVKVFVLFFLLLNSNFTIVCILVSYLSCRYLFSCIIVIRENFLIFFWSLIEEQNLIFMFLISLHFPPNLFSSVIYVRYSAEFYLYLVLSYIIVFIFLLFYCGKQISAVKIPCQNPKFLHLILNFYSIFCT